MGKVYRVRAYQGDIYFDKRKSAKYLIKTSPYLVKKPRKIEVLKRIPKKGIYVNKSGIVRKSR